MIHQDLYWPGIRNAAQKEIRNYETYQPIKRSNIKYGKLLAKEIEKIPQNKLCVDLIGSHVMRRNIKKKIFIYKPLP